MNNEILSSTNAIEECGIEASIARKRIHDFSKGSIRKIGKIKYIRFEYILCHLQTFGIRVILKLGF